MQDPLDPLNGGDPPGDPMLDALERSIENPQGFEDPLAGPDRPLMDELGQLLGAVEASIENTPPLVPGVSETQGVNGPNPSEDDPLDVETAPSLDDMVLPEIADDAGAVLPPAASLEISEGSSPRFTPAGSKAPRTIGRGGRGTRGLAPRRRTYFGGRRTGAGSSSTHRYCSESREIIDEQQCESCDKYRHWPDGTDEEPRECWYDWEESRLLRQGEDDGNVGDAP